VKMELATISRAVDEEGLVAVSVVPKLLICSDKFAMIYGVGHFGVCAEWNVQGNSQTGNAATEFLDGVCRALLIVQCHRGSTPNIAFLLSSR